MSSKELNKEMSEKQTALWDAYLLEIKDKREATDAALATLAKEYNETIAPFTDEYNLSIKPEYDETAAIINPKIEQMRKKLEKIKERATKQTNAALQEFEDWKGKVLEKLEPRIADRLNKYKELIAPFEAEYKNSCDAVQKEFEEITKEPYARYIAEAEKIEEEFKRKAAENAIKKAISEDKTRYNIITDEIVQAPTPTITITQ